MTLPIRTRLTLVFSGLMAAVLAVAGVLFHRGFGAELDVAIDDRLIASAEELVADLADGETGVLHDFGEEEMEGYFAQVLGVDGAVVESSDAGPRPLMVPDPTWRDAAPCPIEVNVVGERAAPGAPARLCALTAPGTGFVLVGTFLDDRDAALGDLALLLWLIGPSLGVVASVLGWLLAGSALRPVDGLRRQAALVTEGNLTRRLPVPPTGDEIAGLATTLNDMLARLEQAFERERRFVDDASHELRTPLAILKTELDLALSRSRTREELQTALASAAEESDRLNRLAEDLLVLARVDRGNMPLKVAPTDVGGLVRDTVAKFQTTAHHQGVELRLDTEEDIWAELDTMRIEQAVRNVLANALAHTPRDGRIEVSVRHDGPATLVLTVADSGPGFPDDFVARAFDPFTRADAGRSRRDGGAGLGLAIVKGIVEAHGGSVAAANKPLGGAVVTLRVAKRIGT